VPGDAGLPGVRLNDRKRKAQAQAQRGGPSDFR